jgi:glutamate-1-semialdehyde 2,1-aminomutase
VYQAGTLSGNPLAMSAGIETLRVLGAPGVWDALERAGERLVSGLSALGGPVRLARVGSMWGLFFAERPIASWEDAKAVDTAAFARFHAAMLDRGVYLAPSQFEAGFLSTAHGDEEIDATIAAARDAFAPRA